MSYPKDHTDDHCDKCGAMVGKENLKPVPFWYLDRNDHTHSDATDQWGRPGHKDYKQYYVCENCERVTTSK